MSRKVTNAEELIALFETKATAPPPESSRIFARHLQCKESLAIARILTEAMDGYAGKDSRRLSPPTEILPPLA